MAFTLRLYTFSKRPNSTKQPSSGGTDYQVTLIEETSLMNPTFKLSIAVNPIHFNYAFCYEFDRYYFITDITSYQNFWYISCRCDVMASWKTDIGSQSHYILRSASDYDEYICDNHYGAKIKETAVKVPISGPLYWGTGHSYVVGITGYAPNTSQQVGSVTYYQMHDTGLYNFIYYLMHNINDWCDIPTALYDPSVQEALLNPIQYIVSCVALPVSFTGDSTSRIHFGYYYFDIPGTGKYKTLTLGQTVTEEGTVTLPKHPQASTRGAFMNAAPFSNYTFHLGPFGDIPLDPADYIDADDLRYKITYDMAQGVGRLVVGPAISGTTNIMNISYCGNVMIGAPVQLSQAIINPLQAQLSWDVGMNNVFTTGMGAGNATNSINLANNLVQAQNILQQTYADALQNKFPNCCGVGTPGSFFNFFDNDYGCYLMYKYFTVVDENLAEIGRPLCQTRQISTLSGYILCQNADAQISGTADEAEQVNAYLNSGFFYE